MSKTKTLDILRAHDTLLRADRRCDASLVDVDVFALNASNDGTCSSVSDLASYVIGMMGDTLRDALADNGAVDLAARMDDDSLRRAYLGYFIELFC